ncbi:hypothetical protein OS493_013122 [Desmophyllum pertusum]|uniref:Uncharacterized protein n=1 Tax=Desmophyllum pertusum TaxID=174260 RepID=A0A9X0CN50_9CNID|nr:hypothetical protein OS493_013122 [Desmophyllum pertusum]
MKRSLSIWKSHEGPDEREVKTKEQTTGEFIPKSSVMYQPQREESIVEHSKSIYSEIFEDADAFIDNESNVGNLNELKDHPDPRNVANKVPSNGAPSEGPQTDGPQPEGPPSDGPLSNNQDTAEDWDKEIQDTLAYNLVLKTFKKGAKTKLRTMNQLCILPLHRPPARYSCRAHQILGSLMMPMRMIVWSLELHVSESCRLLKIQVEDRFWIETCYKSLQCLTGRKMSDEGTIETSG